MSNEHESVQEALAAYALNALDEADVDRVEDLLLTHLPGCPECGAALEAFRHVAGEMALAASPRPAPPGSAEAIERGIVPARRNWGRWIPTAAAVTVLAVVTGLAAWSANLSSRVSAAEDRQAKTTGLLATVSHPQSQVVPLAAEERVTEPIQLAVTFVPGGSALYLFGTLAAPLPDHVYQVWLMRSGRFRSAGTFLPDHGQVLVRVQADAATYDGLLITEEPRTGSKVPSQRHVVTAAF
jgi:hypothetical protein